jgi:hypothetical protein
MEELRLKVVRNQVLGDQLVKISMEAVKTAEEVKAAEDMEDMKGIHTDNGKSYSIHT